MDKDQPRTLTLDKDISSAIRASRWHDARNLLEEKLGSFPLDLLARQKLTSVLMRAERWEEAIASAHEQLKLQPRDAVLIKKLLMLVLKHGGLSSDPSSVAGANFLVATALTLEPDDGLLLRLAGQVALLSGRAREATIILGRALVAEPGDLIARVLLTELLSDKGDHAGSADIFEGALRLRPNDSRLWRTAVSVRQRADRTAEALEAQRTSVALRLPSMAPDLEEGLRRVSGDPVTLPPRMLDWAWSLQLANGFDPSTSRESWRRRVQWGMDADDLILDWLEVHPDRWRDVAKRTELRGVGLLEDAVRSGRGAYLSIAHLGPIHGMFWPSKRPACPSAGSRPHPVCLADRSINV